MSPQQCCRFATTVVGGCGCGGGGGGVVTMLRRLCDCHPQHRRRHRPCRRSHRRRSLVVSSSLSHHWASVDFSLVKISTDPSVTLQDRDSFRSLFLLLLCFPVSCAFVFRRVVGPVGLDPRVSCYNPCTVCVCVGAFSSHHGEVTTCFVCVGVLVVMLG